MLEAFVFFSFARVRGKWSMESGPTGTINFCLNVETFYHTATLHTVKLFNISTLLTVAILKSADSCGALFQALPRLSVFNCMLNKVKTSTTKQYIFLTIERKFGDQCCGQNSIGFKHQRKKNALKLLTILTSFSGHWVVYCMWTILQCIFNLRLTSWMKPNGISIISIW